VLDENLKLPVNPTIKTALEQIKPSLDTYIEAAERIVGLALDNPDSAQRELGTFNTAFTQLEEQMAALSELIESNTRDTSKATDSAIRMPTSPSAWCCSPACCYCWRKGVG
jgi:methyl-accepting chemotaxis protein